MHCVLQLTLVGNTGSTTAPHGDSLPRRPNCPAAGSGHVWDQHDFARGTLPILRALPRNRVRVVSKASHLEGWHTPVPWPDHELVSMTPLECVKEENTVISNDGGDGRAIDDEERNGQPDAVTADVVTPGRLRPASVARAPQETVPYTPRAALPARANIDGQGTIDHHRSLTSSLVIRQPRKRVFEVAFSRSEFVHMPRDLQPRNMRELEYEQRLRRK